MAENDCIFCQILSGEIPAERVYEDEDACAFIDTKPQAPSHILIIPREHMDSLNDVGQGDERLLGHLLRLAAKVANQLGIAESGFRAVINTGPDAGQSVSHLHVHLLGGRTLTWPPG